MLNIVGKSALENIQLVNSVRDGFNTIELQLFGDFLTTPNEKIFKDILSVDGLMISSVHSPLLYSREVEIEDLGDSNTSYPILKTFYLADLLSQHYKKPMPVVVHASSSMDELLLKKDLLYKIVRELDIAMQLFTNVEVCIENTIPVISKGARYSTKNSFLFDTVDICKFLREQLKTTKVYTVLDTCHALTSIRFMEETKEFTNKSTVTLEDFFLNNGNYTRIVHLNNVIDLGLKAGQHSTPFSPTNMKDVELLSNIITYINKYTTNVDCVLEINEEEYVKDSNKNKLLTLETIKLLKADYTL